MTDWLQALRSLQEVDGQRYRLRQEQTRKPQALAHARQQLERMQSEAKRTEEDLKAVQMKQKHREMELAEHEEKIKKLQTQLFQVKTNKEYTAMQHEIEQFRADVSVAEEDILTLLDRVDSAKRQHAETQSRARQEEGQFHQLEQRIQQELSAIDEQLRALEDQRQQMTPGVDGEILALYERALDHGDGLALVLLIKESCGGCHMAQRPQVVNQVFLKAQPAVCESCQRILYVSDDAVVH